MSRGNTFQKGRAGRVAAALILAGSTAWAGEKIEVSTGVVNLPAGVSTNKTGKAEEVSPGMSRFNSKIDDMESRFGWQRNLNRPLPQPGMIPAPSAPVRSSGKDARKEGDDNWLSQPVPSLDYESALGVSMFQMPKRPASDGAAGEARNPAGAPDVSRSRLDSPGALGADNPFAAPTGDYLRPDAMFQPEGLGSLPGVGGGRANPAAGSGFGGGAIAPVPTFNTSVAPEQTVDSILRGGQPDSAFNSVPTLDSILGRNAGSLSATAAQQASRPTVDTILRSYSAPAQLPSAVSVQTRPAGFTPAASSLTLENVLDSNPGGLNTLDARKPSKPVIEPSRGFIDPARRPPAVLPMPKKIPGT